MNLNHTTRIISLVLCLLISYQSQGNNRDNIPILNEKLTPLTYCDLSIQLTPIGVFCNETTGKIDVQISGGTAPFKIEWDNADNTIWAEIQTSDRTYTIDRLPADNYTIKVLDSGGCFVSQLICLKDQVNTLELAVSNNSSACDTKGSVAVQVGNSSPPYWVDIKGPAPNGFLVHDNSFTIDNLPEGDYNVTVRKDDCRASQDITVDNSENTLDIAVEEELTCDGSFAAVSTNITGGHSRYRLYYDGPTKGFTHSNGAKYIQNLAPGTYLFTVCTCS